MTSSSTLPKYYRLRFIPLRNLLQARNDEDESNYVARIIQEEIRNSPLSLKFWYVFQLDNLFVKC
jgi:hypothetical protein